MSYPEVQRYLESLRDGRKIFAAGRIVEDVTAYPPLAPILRTMSRMLADADAYWTRAAHPDFALTPPQSKEDLRERSDASRILAEQTYGLLGRWNDYTLNYLFDMYTLRQLMALGDREAAHRLERFVAYCRSARPFISHALTHPQVDRRRTPLENGAVRVEEVSAKSITVSGTRMVATNAPLANELLILPFGIYVPQQADLVVFCAVPLNLPGISIHLRPMEASASDPLASFDEPDAAVCFDRVTIPMERVFLCRNTEVANQLFPEATPLSYLGALARAVVRLEFIAAVGRALLLAIGAAHFPHNQQKISAAAVNLISIKGLLEAAIAEAVYDPVRACVVPKREYMWAGLLRASEIGKELACLITEHSGAGVLMRLDPNGVSEPAERNTLDLICAGEGVSAQAKSRLLKLAWSVALGPVGARQFLYDRYAFGDPFSVCSYLGRRYDWSYGFDLVQAAVRGGCGG